MTFGCPGKEWKTPSSPELNKQRVIAECIIDKTLGTVTASHFEVVRMDGACDSLILLNAEFPAYHPFDIRGIRIYWLILYFTATVRTV